MSKITDYTSPSSPSKKEVIWASFEPKTTSRFICYTTYKDGTTFLPSFVVRSITRPKCWNNNGEWHWDPISIKCYDPVTPSTTQVFYDYIRDKNPFDMKVHLVAPVGVIIEEWEIINPQITMIDFGLLDWESSSNDTEEGRSKVEHINLVRYYKGPGPLIIDALIKYDYAKLNH